MLPIANVANSQLALGIGYWQHFHIGNILAGIVENHGEDIITFQTATQAEIRNFTISKTAARVDSGTQSSQWDGIETVAKAQRLVAGIEDDSGKRRLGDVFRKPLEMAEVIRRSLSRLDLNAEQCSVLSLDDEIDFALAVVPVV